METLPQPGQIRVHIGIAEPAKFENHERMESDSYILYYILICYLIYLYMSRIGSREDGSVP